MKFEGVLDRWSRREPRQAEVAEMLGMSERSSRRMRNHYEEAGPAAL